MRYVRLLIGLLVCCSLVGNIPVRAIDTAPSEETTIKVDSPFLITGYSMTSYRLNYIQLYNTGTAVVSLDGWSLYYTVEGVEHPLTVTLGGMIKPHGSVVVADQSSVPTALFRYAAPELEAGVNLRISSVRLAPLAGSSYLDHTITPSYPSGSTAVDTVYGARNRSTTTGNYLTSFTATTQPPTQLIQDELYDRPTGTALRVVEVLANPRNCSPLEQAGDCRDYVKLYNPTPEEIDLSKFRIRSGHEGQSASTSNTAQLGGTLSAGAFASYEISVTNSGGWIWLEDMYGMARYDETVVDYPDASAESKKSYSWALGLTGWNWATPQPSAPNRLLEPEDAEAVAGGLTPCAVDQYRNPETNRCNKIEATATLAPCRTDQYRSPETNRCRNLTATGTQLTPCATDEYRSPQTNRCRKLSTGSTSLTPCKAGQYRSPETNRCRSLATASSQLKPCTADQERNAETNRCRKKLQGDGKAGFAVVDEPSVSDNLMSWVALGGVGTVSLGYAGWEWRRELWGGAGKLSSLLPWVK